MDAYLEIFKALFGPMDFEEGPELIHPLPVGEKNFELNDFDVEEFWDDERWSKVG